MEAINSGAGRGRGWGEAKPEGKGSKLKKYLNVSIKCKPWAAYGFPQTYVITFGTVNVCTVLVVTAFLTYIPA